MNDYVLLFIKPRTKKDNIIWFISKKKISQKNDFKCEVDFFRHICKDIRNHVMTIFY